MPRLVKISELASMLGVSRRKIWRLLAAAQLPPPVRLGRRTVRWRDADISEFIAAGCDMARFNAAGGEGVCA